MTDFTRRQHQEAKRRLAFLRNYCKLDVATALFGAGKVSLCQKYGDKYLNMPAEDSDLEIIRMTEEHFNITIYMAFRLPNTNGEITDIYAYVSPYEQIWDIEMENLRNGDLLALFINWETKEIVEDYVSIWDETPPVIRKRLMPAA